MRARVRRNSCALTFCVILERSEESRSLSTTYHSNRDKWISSSISATFFGRSKTFDLFLCSDCSAYCSTYSAHSFRIRDSSLRSRMTQKSAFDQDGPQWRQCRRTLKLRDPTVPKARLQDFHLRHRLAPNSC